jgi:hypothetical protein
MKLFEQIGKSIAAKVATVVVVILVLVGVYFGLKVAFPNFSFSFKRELKIAETANVVEQIKKISEFTTACYYEEFVLTKERNDAPNRNISKALGLMHVEADSIHNEIAIICKATVRAGYDLSEISENELKVSNDTINITLPAPKVFDVIMNPSDYEVFVEEGKWTHEEITAMQTDAQKEVLVNAINTGILQKVNEVGKVRIEEFFKTFGFNVVNVMQKSL